MGFLAKQTAAELEAKQPLTTALGGCGGGEALAILLWLLLLLFGAAVDREGFLCAW
eukprot:CAMPEP_0171530606 /NCGR_PEP_ID=MMETSP0959-20130129/13215_1 /TAXON_ID=87120 /ORGANISM="Aurantiochytrium limacinum, Strain ATCCMYA-1381" /LENGTH=55 /DNA_ID=CAMNT_0012073505 /DNA_START=71 /DNA_END=235 /DNA_ORIENTATION=+